MDLKENTSKSQVQSDALAEGAEVGYYTNVMINKTQDRASGKCEPASSKSLTS